MCNGNGTDIASCFSDEMMEDLGHMESYEDVLRHAARKLTEMGRVKDSFEGAILAREAEFPTGLRTSPFGVAIPHTFPQHVNKTGVFVMRLAEPVSAREMGSEDGVVDDVRLVFMLLLKSEAQITMLQGLMALFMDEGSMNRMIEAEDMGGIHAVIGEFFESWQENS